MHPGGAEISSGGGKKIARYPPSPQCFLLSYTTLLILAHFIDILDTCYKEIHKIYFFFTFSCSSFKFYTQVRVPRIVLGSGGGSKFLEMVRGWRRHPLNRLKGGEGGRATPLKSPLIIVIFCYKARAHRVTSQTQYKHRTQTASVI